MSYYISIRIAVILPFHQNIEDLIKPELKNEYEKDKYNFISRSSQDIQPDCTIDGIKITFEAFEL